MNQETNKKIAERLEYFNRKQEEEKERKNNIIVEDIEETIIFES